MKFKENATVLAADRGEVGHLEQLVIDPRTKEVTDVIVRTGSLLSKEDKVVPINLISSAQGEEILLRPNAGKLQSLPDYKEEHFIPITRETRKELEYEPPIPVMVGYYPHSYSVPGQSPLPTYVKETEKNIPEHTVALEIGASVISIDDDHVGDIETILSDAEADRVTHFVITQGLLMKERRIVPTTWVSHIEGDKVYLAVDTELLNSLPEYGE